MYHLVITKYLYFHFVWDGWLHNHVLYLSSHPSIFKCFDYLFTILPYDLRVENEHPLIYYTT